MQILTLSDFPALLAEIPDAPEQLFVRGTLPSYDDYKYLCVVGSRSASDYGRRACASLIAALAHYPICIVSGLALGIDADAHTTALRADLPTVAVLPSSADDASIYPVLNRPIAAQILAKGGALVSEYEAKTRAATWTFPARNRIMAGLSHATLIIEAAEKSGTLITVRLALDYNRDVCAIPHPIDHTHGAGNNRLIREGCALIRTADDILEVLGLKTRTATVQQALPLDITENERATLTILTEPLVRDEIIERAGLSAQQTNIDTSNLVVVFPFFGIGRHRHSLVDGSIVNLAAWT